MELLESQLVEKDAALHPEPVAEEEPKEPQIWFARMERSTMTPRNGLRGQQDRCEGQVRGRGARPGTRCAGDDEGDQVADVKEVDVYRILKSIRDCPNSDAASEPGTARDAAVDTPIQSGGIVFNDKKITLNASRVEL